MISKSCVLYLALCFPVASAIADEFDDGTVAYKEGRYETAASVFEKLAEKGDHRAMSIIGSMYASGLGISLDPKKAFVWLEEAAKHNRPDAEYRLGLMYDHGYGVKRNHRKAIRCYQKAAEHGYVPAHAMMGLKYAKGEGLKQNKVKAYARLSLAKHNFTDNEVEKGDLEKVFPFADRQTFYEVFESLDEELTAEEKETAVGLAREIAAESGTTPVALPITNESKIEGTDCVHRCLLWSRSCNVDPRGRYKCPRRCEKFGEICE